MTLTAITGGRILTPSGINSNEGLYFDNLICGFGQNAIQPTHFNQTYKLPDDWIIAPGFVDLHIHGCSGHDVMDASPQALATMAQTMVKHGVTGFLGATMTMGHNEIVQALENARLYLQEQNEHPSTEDASFSKFIPRAKMWGIHLEGPFISTKALGAQNPAYVQKPDLQLVEAFKDIIRMVTYAPEEDQDLQFTKALVQLGIVPSIGHTACTYDMAHAAFNAGASHMTHLFNAMTPLHHREPGAVGAALNLDFTLEIIADNVHIRPELYRMIHKLKNGQLALITDSMRAGCMKCGLYNLGGQTVVVDETSARLENGALAGSILTMDQAVRNYYQQLLSAQGSGAGATQLLADALRAASTIPAGIAGLPTTGSLEFGKRADLIVLDADFQVRMTFVEGQLCHQL